MSHHDEGQGTPTVDRAALLAWVTRMRDSALADIRRRKCQSGQYDALLNQYESEERHYSALLALLKSDAERVQALELDLSCRESTLHMAVARLGGTVEGHPTARLNFLQRIDELREIETDRDRLVGEVERLKGDLDECRRNRIGDSEIIGSEMCRAEKAVWHTRQQISTRAEELEAAANEARRFNNNAIADAHDLTASMLRQSLAETQELRDRDRVISRQLEDRATARDPLAQSLLASEDMALTRAEKAEAEVTRLTAQWEVLKATLEDDPEGPNDVLQIMAELEAQR